MKGKCCECEFCFPDKSGFVCADAYYGENITDSLDQEKDCYSEGFESFVNQCKKEEIAFIPGYKLSQLKFDGRKSIYLIDEEDKQIQIKFSKAKLMFGEMEIVRQVFDDAFKIKGYFKRELFNGSKILIIK
jgi:hypothetical protein